MNGARLNGVRGVAAEHVGRRRELDRALEFLPSDVEIAKRQDAAMRRAAAANPPVLLLDTDPLMTAAWAAMLYGHVPHELMLYEKAERYLLFDVDTAWVEDGTRFFGSAAERALFEALAEEMLIRAGVPYERISGSWEGREAAVRAIIEPLSPSAEGRSG